ncbi:MAG: Hsp70 family protein [Ignavibacteria bacterium]|nr:Hsp70 family protein [Ignavibacteria bacterium]
MKKVIGIDLGTTNSVVSFKRSNSVEILRNDDSEELTRSCVSILNEELIVGRVAFNNLGRNPEDVILSIKRLMGMSISDPNVETMIEQGKDLFGYYKYNITKQSGSTDAIVIILIGREYTPEQMSSEILRKLKSIAEKYFQDDVTNAVITVPAYFSEKQKTATRIAANMAGLKVSQLLAEPTAAAIAYGVDELIAGQAKTVLVYDFGGGTFDLSVLNIIDGQYFEMGTSGDRWLGGDDLDRAIQKYIIDRISKEYNIENINDLIRNLRDNKRYIFLSTFRVETEKLKIQLSSTNSANLTLIGILQDSEGDDIDIDVTITRNDLEQIIKPFVSKSISLVDKLLKDIGYEIEMIDHILLVGGTSCIPLVKQMLADNYGAARILASKRPMLTVAEGAAILAHRLSDEYECPQCGSVVLQSQKICNCKFDLESEIKKTGINEVLYTAKDDYFIELANNTEDIIVKKQSTLPLSVSREYETTTQNQRIVKVNIFTIKENNIKETQTLGYFTIAEELPLGSKIVFDIEFDINETFKCFAYLKNRPTDKKQVRLSRGSIDTRAYESITNKIQDLIEGDYTYTQKESTIKFINENVKQIENIRLDDNHNEAFSKVYVLVDGYVPPNEVDNTDQWVLFCANILTSHFDFLLGPNHQKMLRLIEEAQQDEDVLLKIQAIRNLEEFISNYNFLIEIFALNLASKVAEDKNSHSDAVKLKQYYDKIYTCLKESEFEEAKEILEQAGSLINKYLGSDKISTLLTK